MIGIWVRKPLGLLTPFRNKWGSLECFLWRMLGYFQMAWGIHGSLTITKNLTMSPSNPPLVKFELVLLFFLYSLMLCGMVFALNYCVLVFDCSGVIIFARGGSDSDCARFKVIVTTHLYW